MNTIHWTDKALRQARKIKDKAVRARLFDETQSLRDFPNCAGIKRLTDHAHSYRLRVGDYRVFFEFDGGVKVIFIEEVKKRDEHTY
ncbi:MAG: type II toxin-antitoxin system RelE/ParE family toxin [Methylococcaceae bacterium]|nr:MAG: type II toxin-antitoxin system RelE/ParE family toxin [Methylococcaceae bacterium]